MYYGEKDKTDNIISDINFKHTPDSVREDAIRELKSRYGEHEANRLIREHRSWYE